MAPLSHPADPDASLSAQLQGRYRVLAKLGEGATSEVYLVQHTELGHREALKVLHPQLAGSEEFVRRFRREARALHRLQHPNIVSLHELGRTLDGRFFLTYEVIDGTSLDAEVAHEGPMSVSRAVDVLLQLADALGHAHARGVIHRDLKPQNLMLLEQRGRPDVVKILDFGVAKIVAPSHVESVNLTKQGAVLGSPAYLAPEQVLGEGQPDLRVDIYAIGCIAYELLTGEPPFTGRLMDVLHAHCSRAPTPPSHRATSGTIPEQLDDIVLRCLAKQPEARFGSTRELTAALRQVPIAHPRRDPADLLRGDDTLLDTADDGELAGATGESFQPALRIALTDLAGALVDAGCSDFRLLSAITTVSELEADLVRADRHLRACKEYADQLEQRAMQMQSSLRFAASQLRFERDHAQLTGRALDADLEFQIQELERRAAEVQRQTQEQLAEEVDRILQLTVDRSNFEESLRAHDATLEAIIRDLAPRYLGGAGIGPAVERYRDVRARAGQQAAEVWR